MGSTRMVRVPDAVRVYGYPKDCKLVYITGTADNSTFSGTPINCPSASELGSKKTRVGLQRTSP